MTLQVGDKAPDFELKDNHGATVRLSDFRGRKNVVLLFYPFAFTGVCTGELCELRDNLPQFSDRDTQVLAVSNDSIHTLRVFAEQEGLEYPLLSDFWPHGNVCACTASSTRTRAAPSGAPSSSTRRAWSAGPSSTACRTPVT